jgi:hypothetical protein
MTTKTGRIFYYTDNGNLARTVTAEDVAALERQVAELQHDLNYYMYGIGQLERRLQIADAIMREVGHLVPPRLVQAWNEAKENVGR